MIYLDHAATTPVAPEVVDVITHTLQTNFGNPSSMYQLGRDAKKVVEQARLVFANSIHAKAADIIITSGASESNNTAIIATALALREKGKHLITTSVEHHSVMHPMQHLETLGFEVTYLPVDKTGRVTVEQVKEAVRQDTVLVSIIYGNNETGMLNPIQEIGTMLKEYDVIFHTDAVQAYGSQEIDVEKSGIDMLSTTAHKINGPKGIGFLYRKTDLHLPNYIHGGTQENDHRAGTENTAYMLGFAQAVELMLESREKRNTYKRNLKSFFLEQLRIRNVSFEVNGTGENSLPHILNIWFPHLQSDKFLIQCDLKGIMLSAGSACTAGSLEPSHVLTSMYGTNSPRINESVRISFGESNTEAELIVLADLIETLQQRYQN